MRAQARVGLRHQLVKEPHIDEVEELREQLDGEGRVDSAPPQKGHGARKRVQNIVCFKRGSQGLFTVCSINRKGTIILVFILFAIKMVQC